MICGNFHEEESYFPYRSSSWLTEFFKDAGTEYIHDGSTRAWWVAATLEEIMNGPSQDPHTPPEAFQRVIATLMDKADAKNEGPERTQAMKLLNASLARDGLEAFYGDDGLCYLRNTGTGKVTARFSTPHRPMSADELKKKEAISSYLNDCSEDELTEKLLLPLFRQLGFHRITASGHKDKALEYGKDIWMKFTLPTQNVLYFGIQVKKGKLDASGNSRRGSTNIAEVVNQIYMMLGHEIFDPELNRKVLVDHVFVICGGEITKQARNWLVGQLDSSQRRQIMFLEREDIMNLLIVSKTPLPTGVVLDNTAPEEGIPF